MKQVDKKSTFLWTMENFQTLIICICLIAVVYYFFGEYIIVRRFLLVLSFYFIGVFLVNIIMNPLRYRNFRYSINDGVINIWRGGLVVLHETIPIRRVQHVDIEQTLYSRLFQLYSINIYTAGLDHTICFLTEKVATELKEDIINQLINEGLAQDEQEKRSYY